MKETQIYRICEWGIHSFITSWSVWNYLGLSLVRKIQVIPVSNQEKNWQWLIWERYGFVVIVHTLQCHRWISSHSSAALSPVSSSSSGAFTDWQSLLCLQGLTLKAGCDWWQVPAARAASPSHQLCTGLKFTHRLTQYLLRSSRLHACCIYQKNIHVWVSWTQRRNSETASCCCCWKRAEPGCLLCGQFLWEGTLAGF